MLFFNAEENKYLHFLVFAFSFDRRIRVSPDCSPDGDNDRERFGLLQGNVQGQAQPVQTKTGKSMNLSNIRMVKKLSMKEKY